MTHFAKKDAARQIILAASFILVWYGEMLCCLSKIYIAAHIILPVCRSFEAGKNKKPL